MIYKLTMERTQRIGVEFEASDDTDAVVQAQVMYSNAMRNPSAFSGGDVEGDFALCDESGQDIIPWS